MNNIIKRVWNQNRLVNIEDLTGMVFQAESGGHTFEISGIDDTGAAVELSGTVSGVFRRPDNADIAITGSASDGVVSVTLSEDCYAVPGRFGLTIFVTSNSQKVAVYACVGTVAVSSTGNVAGDTPASVEDLIDDINAAIADLNTAIGSIPADYSQFMAAIAPTYSSSALYSVGSYAWYNGSLYRCITAITTAEAWTAAHWTAAVLGDDVGDLKSAVANLDTVVLPQTVDATEALVYYPIAPSVGDRILITSKGGAYTKTWSALFYASDKSTLLQQQNVYPSDITKEITITESGIAYIRPNVNFSVGAKITVFSGDTLVEKADSQASLIDANTQAISQNAQDIADIKSGKNNLYGGIKLISGRVYNGVFSDAITTVHCTDFLPITPGRTYAIYGGFIDANYSNYYDSSKTYKGSLPLDGLNDQYPYNNSNNFLLFTAPADAAYTRVNFMNSHLIDGTDMKPEWFFRDITDFVWAKKKVLVIGDSISTDVYGGYKKWVTNLLDEEFFTNGLTTNNSQHATGFVATYNGQANTTFIQRLTAVGDLSGFDAIITFGGINDWIQSVDFDTFKTAVDTYFEYLIENATQARIIVFTPLHTALYGSANSAGKTQKDYDDYIKSVAVDYAFPLLNLTDESGFCPDKSTTFRDMWTLLPEGYSSHDGVHPTADWEKDFLAPMIKGFLSILN